MQKRRVRSLASSVLLVALALLLAGALSVRLRLRGPLNGVRQFNKHVVNRLTGPWAGRPGSPFVRIQHVGRRSGRRYATPVMAALSAGRLYICLTYGPQTDWVRNVRAEGHAVIIRAGRAYPVGAPEVVGPAAALPAFSRPVRLGCRLLGITAFLALRVEGSPTR